MGRININDDKFLIKFYSDFDQLKYVFVEIEQEREIIIQPKEEESIDISSSANTEEIKLSILNEQLKILNETNEKFLQENQLLKSELNKSKNNILDLQKKIDSQNKKINQNFVDQDEFEFLKLNLLYSHKCQTRKLFSAGYKVGTPEYKACILRKGEKIR